MVREDVGISNFKNYASLEFWLIYEEPTTKPMEYCTFQPTHEKGQYHEIKDRRWKSALVIKPQDPCQYQVLFSMDSQMTRK